MADLIQNRQILKRIEVMLSNRRRTFFTIHPDAKKQQLIIMAEAHLYAIKNPADETFIKHTKRFADCFIKPLIPSQISRYYTNYRKLYDEIQQLN